MCIRGPFFSIIVPVYNVEDYLDKCIDSIVTQSISDFELLLIDNGSTDASKNICMSRAKLDSRIKVYSQRKRGPAATKNLGLKHAIGDYVVFVDSDDYIVDDMLAVVLKAIKANDKPDVVYFNYYNLCRNKLSIHHLAQYPLMMTISQAYQSQFMVDGYRGFVFNKVFKSEIIQRIQFNEDLFYLEDSVFVAEMLNNEPRIITLQDPLYVYRYRKTSISHTSYNTHRLTYVKAMDLLIHDVPNEYIGILVPAKKIAEIDVAAKVVRKNRKLYLLLKKSFDEDLIVNENRSILSLFQRIVLKISDYSFELAIIVFLFHDEIKKFF